MPKYEVEQYELHATTYQVEADSPAQAIQLILKGEEEAILIQTELVEVADQYGMPSECNQDIETELAALGVFTNKDMQDIIPSIREVREV